MIEVAGRGLYLVGVLAALLACKALEKTDVAPAASAATPGAGATPTASPAGDDKPKTNFDGPKDNHGVDLAKVLGTKSDGWSVPALSKLKEDMSPAEVGRVIAGAEKLDEFGFAEVKQSSPKGVDLYKFSYQDAGGKKGLKFVTIQFDPKLADEPFWVALASHLKEKLGSDLTDHGGHHINWIGPGMNMWSLSKGITHEGYELQIAVAK